MFRGLRLADRVTPGASDTNGFWSSHSIYYTKLRKLCYIYDHATGATSPSRLWPEQRILATLAKQHFVPSLSILSLVHSRICDKFKELCERLSKTPTTASCAD